MQEDLIKASWANPSCTEKKERSKRQGFMEKYKSVCVTNAPPPPPPPGALRVYECLCVFSFLLLCVRVYTWLHIHAYMLTNLYHRHRNAGFKAYSCFLGFCLSVCILTSLIL